MKIWYVLNNDQRYYLGSEELLLCYCLLLLRSIVASGTGSSSELVKNSSNRDIGNVVVSDVKVGVLVVVVSIVCSVGFKKTILKKDSYDTLSNVETGLLQIDQAHSWSKKE